MDPWRIVVATSPANVSAASAAPLVGIFEWSSPEEWCGVIVKARVAGADPSTILRPQALLARPAQADALRRPVDFVPMKEFVDLILLGHVELGRGSAAMLPIRTAGALRVGEAELPIELSADRSGRVPLGPPHLRIPSIQDADCSLGVRNLYDGGKTEFSHRKDFPWELTQAGNPLLARPEIAEGARVALELKSSAGAAEPVFDLALPPLSPRVLIDPSQAGRDRFEVPMRLDTVVVDVDAGELELTWRGMFPTFTGVGDADRILVGWASDAATEEDKGAWPALLRELVHGHFEHAWFFSDAEAGRAPEPLSEKDLKHQRYKAWSYPLSPAPRIELEQLAEIEARLGERREPRGDTFARHGLDEQRFAIEQRAWMERIAAEGRVTVGRPPLARRYSVALARASKQEGA